MILLFALLSHPAQATAQVSNRLIIDGQLYPLRSQPLSGSEHRVDPAAIRGWAQSTACWAGYTSTWIVDQGQLWFAGLHECHESRSATAGEALKDVPDEVERLAATWYTGTLTVPMGELIKYVHMGWSSVYSQERQIRVEAGRVTSDQVRVLVEEGYAYLDLGLCRAILAPRDLVDSPMQIEQEGDRTWVSYQGASPERSLRAYPVLPPTGPEPTPMEPAPALSQHLGRPLSPDHRQADLQWYGKVAWEDQPSADGRSTIRAIAWAMPDQTCIIELRTAPGDSAGRDSFIRQFAGPR